MIIIFYKDLKQDFEKELTCLQENTEKYKIISLPTTKEAQALVKMVKKLKKPYLTNLSLLIAQDLWQAHYASSLSNVIDNLAEGIHKIKCKYRQAYKKVKQVELKEKY